MKTLHNKLTCLLILAGIISATLRIQAEPTNSVSELVKGNNAFAFDLYGKLSSGEENLFFSPFSVSACLGMVYAGARGETEKQMARTLHFDLNQALVHASFGELQKQLIQDSPLRIANVLVAQKGSRFETKFLDYLQKMYQAEFKQFDFQSEAQRASDEMNRWVSQKTEGKIDRLLEPETLNGGATLVLLNAVHFRAEWEKPFKSELTISLPFYLPSGASVDAKMMSQTDNFGYFENEQLKALELPYVGGKISMVMILPNRQNGLSEIEKIVTSDKLSSWVHQMSKPEVKVQLPKFKLEKNFKLTHALGLMGMPDAFCPTANFTGISASGGLYISEVVHKAFIEVDEKGTEAAAATGAIMWYFSSEKAPPKIFFANHPFLFAIRDNETGSISFMGRVTNPIQQ